MTGPEHYREAERLLDITGNDPHCPEDERARLEGRAQVHATLALAATLANGLPVVFSDDVRESLAALRPIEEIRMADFPDHGASS